MYFSERRRSESHFHDSRSESLKAFEGDEGGWEGQGGGRGEEEVGHLTQKQLNEVSLAVEIFGMEVVRDTNFIPDMVI